MNRLSIECRALILKCLVDGNSMLATSRIAEVSKNTVKKLLIDVGTACAEYQNKTLRNLPCTTFQVDEIWSFCYAKKKNVPEKYQGKFGYGDVWTFTAIDAKTKLVPCWLVGNRNYWTATVFLKDLYSRLSNRGQLTTDGHKMYLSAVDNAFGTDVDFAQLIKIYGQTSEGEKRYSPSNFIESIQKEIFGNPDPKKISTSYAERQNLTMRMNMRRFTRLANGFSKKVENLGHSVALHFMYYNFCRIHTSLRVTPAMEASMTDRLWDIEDIVGLIKQVIMGDEAQHKHRKGKSNGI